MKHLLLFFFFLFLSCTGFPGETLQICKFKDDKKAALSLTFDDGTRDHLQYALPLLERYGFKGTFYIIIRRVPERVKDPSSRTGYLTWDELRRFLKAGHEIGNHSLTHRRQLTRETNMEDVRREINAPIPIFREKLGIDVETFCYPGASSTREIEALVLEHHLGASRWRFPCGGSSFTLEKWSAFLDRTIAKGNDEAAMIHSIVPEAKGWMPFASLDQFDSFLREVKRRETDLWVDTYSAVVRYKRLRENSVLTILSENADTMQCELRSDVPARLIRPLTVKYSGSDLLRVEQNGRPVPFRKSGDGVLFEIRPGAFLLKKLSVPDTK